VILRDASGPFFGEYGGRFMPESLIAAIDELAAAYESAKVDPEFQASWPSCTAPTPVAPRSSPRCRDSRSTPAAPASS
jgi:tryptophan synthase beta subunit